MSLIKNFSLSGLYSNIQLGKRGGYINYNSLTPDNNNSTTPAIQFYQPDGSTLSRIQVANPLTEYDAATKYYVDSVIQGLNLKESVYVASIANIPLTGSVDSNGTLLIDGVETPANSRILLKDQTDATENGIYILNINSSTSTYTLTRSSDADNKDENGNNVYELTSGTFVFVETGNTNADTGWVLSSPVGDVHIGTDQIEWVQFSSAGVTSAGAGLSKDGVVLSVSPDNSSIYIDTSGKVAVKSSTDGLVMVSQTGNNTGVWGQVDLLKGVKNTLPTINGGTGISTYSNGDILVGKVNTDNTTTLEVIVVGKTNQTLTVTDSNGTVAWNYSTSIYNSSGVLTLTSVSQDTNTSYIEISGADTGKSTGYDSNNDIYSGADISVAGTDSDINLTLTPKGNGILLARSGYSSYLSANYSRPTDGSTDSTPLIPDDSIATVGFIMDKIIVPDTTRIYHDDTSGNTTAQVETNKDGYSDTVVVSAGNQVISTFTSVDPDNSATATSGEHLVVTATTGEVRLYAADNTSTDVVNMRLIPQSDGFVYLGDKGSGLIKSEDTYSLTLSGGDGTSSVNAGNIILQGGSSISSTTNGGDVIIQGGAPNTSTGSTSIGGDTFIKDSYGNNIAQFTTSVNNAVNYFSIKNSADSTDQNISGIHIGASVNSTSTNVSVYIDTIGTGLLRASDGDTYTTNLSASGNDNAFVTKQYVDATVGGATIPDGHGITTYTDSGTTYRTIDFGNSNTIGFDSSYDIVVKSGSTEGLVLLSQTGASTVNEADWGKIDLSTQNSIENALSVINGGTGISSYTIGDILYANSTSTLTSLHSSQASANQVLSLTTDTNGNVIPSYNYVSTLYDSNGNILINGTGVNSAINYVTVTNAISGSNPIIGVASSTANTYLSLNISTGSNGLIYVNSSYTAALSDANNINSENALVSKQYVDSSIASGGDPLLVKQNISSNYAQSMDIGIPKAAIVSKSIVASRVIVDVSTVMSGGSIDGMRVYVGNNTTGTLIMDIEDSDILSTGTYIKDLDYLTDISGTQITAYFYEEDGSTLTTPTAGNITVIVNYNIISS